MSRKIDATKNGGPLHFKLRVNGMTQKVNFLKIGNSNLDMIWIVNYYYSTFLFQLIYNLNSRYAYDDRIPIWATGQQKGEKGAEAYEKERKAFKTNLKAKTGLTIGELI